MIERIVITATRSEEPVATVPAAVSIVDRSAIQEARTTVSLDESLRRVPGVLVQNSGNFAQDLRIQIRGFGTRAAFGIREIRVLVDGLPETLPDGQTELGNLDLGTIERIEVVRDPTSSLYGNASGGVIQLFTEDGPEQPWSEARATGGSFGLQKYQLKGGGRVEDAHGYVSVSHLRLDGFRDHSETEKTIVTGKLRYHLNDHTRITALLNGLHSPVAEDPGGLTREEAKDDPSGARDRNVLFDAGEEVAQVKLGFVLEHVSGPHDVSGYTYLLYRDFDNLLPFQDQGSVTFERLSPGAGVRYSYERPVLRVDQQFSIGFDVQHQDDDRRRFDNLEGQRGNLRIHQRERVTSIGTYAREAVFVTDDVEISGGVRYDRVYFDVDVESDDTGLGTGSDSRTMDEWSPAGGVLYSPRTWLSLYGKIGTTFQVPSTTELVNPRGSGLNPELEPQTAISYEVGSRFDWTPYRGSIAAFRLDLDDELIPFEDSESGRTAFRNAGRSRRYGLEVEWAAQLLDSLRWTGAVTWIDAEFRDYVVDGVELDGNQEPGIPSWWIFQELAYRHSSGFYAALEAFFVDALFVDDANTTRSPSYELLNLRAGFVHTAGAWTFSPFLGLANLTDAEYDGTVRLNAQGGRFFEPAPGFNAYGGLAVSARL